MMEADQFDRRVFLASLTVVGIVVALTGWLVTRTSPGNASTASEQTATHETASPLALPHPLADFQLIERSGQTVTRDNLAGQFLIVNFVFTSCSLSCRAVNDRMAEIQRLIADAPDVRLISLSVDPRTDTPSVLTKFADSFHADANRWLFLTSTNYEIHQLIKTSFIPGSPDLNQLIPGGFTDTDRIMLVDKQGNVCASFNGLNRQIAATVVAEIEKRRKMMGRNVAEVLN